VGRGGHDNIAALKESVVELLPLEIPIFKAPFEIETNASGLG